MHKKKRQTNLTKRLLKNVENNSIFLRMLLMWLTSAMILPFQLLDIALEKRKRRRKRNTWADEHVWFFFIAGLFEVIGKPRVSKRQDSQMSTDRQHIGTQFHPEATNVLIKSLEMAELGAQKDKEMRVKWKQNNIRAEVTNKGLGRRTFGGVTEKQHIDGVQLDIERGRKVGQIEVIPWRRGEVWGDGGRRRGWGGGCSPETVKLETSDAQLGVQAGGWESSFGVAVWVVVGGGLGWVIVDRRFAEGDGRRAWPLVSGSHIGVTGALGSGFELCAL